MMLEVSEAGVLGTRGPAIQTFAETVGRYGLHTESEQMLRRQLEMRGIVEPLEATTR